jgi:hypothetical protein
MQCMHFFIFYMIVMESYKKIQIELLFEGKVIFDEIDCPLLTNGTNFYERSPIGRSKLIPSGGSEGNVRCFF